ncbi:MAG: hypothetical protein WAV73_04895 [Candidatus Moraniibacteriota bacterium]
MENKTFIKIRSIIFQLALFFLALLLPAFKFDFDISTILTVVTLLFTILVGFFIAAATSNYLRLQTIISDEDASLISLFGLVKILQPTMVKKIRNSIDKYMIAALDYGLLDYAEYTSGEVDALLSTIDEVTPSKKHTESLIQNLHNIKVNIISIRQEMAVLIKRIVTARHWFILVSLAAIISVILLSLRSGNIITSSLIGLIMITLYQTLRLLHQIDSNLFLASQLAYEVPQKVFLAIGQLRYYPEYALSRKTKKALKNECYRVGLYKNFPETMEKKIKIISPAK